jgi:hypothetical protein
MTRERWRQVKQILYALEDCPIGEREHAITAACGEDADLRREVESLLAFEDRAEILERYPDRAATAPSTPERIGPYRIERLLGSGGMGSLPRGSR